MSAVAARRRTGNLGPSPRAALLATAATIVYPGRTARASTASCRGRAGSATYRPGYTTCHTCSNGGAWSLLATSPATTAHSRLGACTGGSTASASRPAWRRSAGVTLPTSSGASPSTLPTSALRWGSDSASTLSASALRSGADTAGTLTAARCARGRRPAACAPASRIASRTLGIPRRSAGCTFLPDGNDQIAGRNRPTLGNVDLVDHTPHGGRYIHRRFLGLESDERSLRLDPFTGFDEHIDDGNVFKVAHIGHSYFDEACSRVHRNSLQFFQGTGLEGSMPSFCMAAITVL